MRKILFGLMLAGFVVVNCEAAKKSDLKTNLGNLKELLQKLTTKLSTLRGKLDDLKKKVDDSSKFNTEWLGIINRYTRNVKTKEETFDDIKTLLEKGADINAKIIHFNDKKRKIISGESTPLSFAVWLGDKDIINYMLDKGANANLVFKEKPHGLETVALLKAFLSYTGRDGEKELKEIIKLLLDRVVNINVNIADKNKDTPLHLAAKRGWRDIVELLLDKGADAKAVNNDGDTPLHYAAEKEDTTVAERLLKNGAAVNSTNNKNETPLLYALRFVQFGLARFLLDNGADVKIKDKDGHTPLYWAMHTGKEKTILFEIEKIVTKILDCGIEQADIKNVLKEPDLKEEIRKLLETRIPTSK